MPRKYKKRQILTLKNTPVVAEPILGVRPPKRHPDLRPSTITGLVDAFKLNEIPFSYEFEDAYCCRVKAAGLDVEINPQDMDDCLQFFRDVMTGE